jgi:hypothetical protein
MGTAPEAGAHKVLPYTFYEGAERKQKREGLDPPFFRPPPNPAILEQNHIAIGDNSAISFENLQNRCAILKRALNKRPYGCGG